MTFTTKITIGQEFTNNNGTFYKVFGMSAYRKNRFTNKGERTIYLTVDDCGNVYEDTCLASSLIGSIENGDLVEVK